MVLSAMRLLVLLMTVAVLAVRAQSATSTAPNQVLKDLPRAGLSCQKDEVRGPPKAAASEAALPAADLRCMVNPSVATELLKRPDALLVDTRLAGEFGRYRAPGAINLSPSELAGKPYLKGKLVILLGGPREAPAMYRHCALLKAQGFDRVHVFRGGWLGWLTANLPVEGRLPSVAELSRLQPEDLWALAQVPGTTTLLGTGSSTLQQRFPLAVPVQDISATGVASALLRRERESKGLPLTAVVLATERVMSDADLAAVQARVSPVPIFVSEPPRLSRRLLRLRMEPRCGSPRSFPPR